VTGRMPTGNGTCQKPPPTGQKPPNPKGADQATKDNDLTTGHTKPSDGGDDNSDAAQH
jgi:hypothetical protein